MKVYSQLEVASFENLSADPSLLPTGRFWFNTTDLLPKVHDGTTALSLLSSKKAIFGTSGTVSNNIKLHRAGSAHLQIVPANDATLEGSVATSLAQVGIRHEVFTDAGKPTAGNAGRVVYLSDLQVFVGDNGTAWNTLGGGGGAGSIQWIEDAQAPTPLIENAMQVYAYQAGQNQKLYALIRVPDSYTSGRQLKLKLGVYSADSNPNNIIIRTVATLIRKNVDAITSTANQRTSTNSAITLSGATVDVPQEITFDLSDATGAINSVSVSKGDYILIQLTRASDSSSQDVKALVYGAEVLLS